MSWIIALSKKWLVGRRSKLAGVCCFAIALLGIGANIQPDMFPMVDVMSWDEIGLFIAGGFAAFGIGGKADKLIEEMKANTAAVKETTNVPQTIASPELTAEQRQTLDHP